MEDRGEPRVDGSCDKGSDDEHRRRPYWEFPRSHLETIPVLGHLFRYDKRQRAKTNLMVFLRPYVIRDANAGRGLTQDRYDFMRTQQSRAQPGRCR